MKPDSHIKRALLLIALIVIFGNAGRLFMVPATYGQYGEFRGDHLAEERSRDPIHRGTDICVECHDDKLEEKGAGAHAPVPCENCHFQPYAGDENHPNAHPEVSQSPDRSQRACLVCHQYFPSRPAEFPQLLNFHEHITGNGPKITDRDIGEVNINTLCVHCHNPHDPVIEVQQNG